uniref:Stabilin 1 n=1 Tax=Neolamprologus brichardi TaxID=32507 RepID=A0A3Q4HAZ7_NEOBR
MLSQACFLCIVTQLVEIMCIQHESAHNEFLILLDKQVSSAQCFFTLKENKAESQTFKDYYEAVRTSEICLKTAFLCAVCDCKHGVCNKGPEGDGECLCQPPYTGRNCDQENRRCNNCSPYSYCKGEGDAAVCECLPGYRKTARFCVCSQRDCDVNAQCSSRGLKVSCACKPGYLGDGKICIPQNPCLDNNGGCPLNSTVCVFKGANKSSCACMSGMSPIGGSPESGCQLVSACSVDTCDPTARCQTELNGEPRCVCEVDQISDGRRCYGNLMERVMELDRSGSWRGNFTGAISMFEAGCPRLLNHNGPFTAFIPLLKSPLPVGHLDLNQETLCKNHLILGQYLYKDLTGRDFNLYGGSKLRTKENKRFILLDNPRKLYSVIQQDLPASNGIIHIIDQPITPTDSSPRDEQICVFLQNCGAPPPLRGPGPLTVFVPTNQAVDRARDGSILYMLNDAKYKLQELLRHHVFSQAALTVDDLSTLSRIQTMANQMVKIAASEDGGIVLGEKSIRLMSTNIVASNGIIHMIDGLLYPPSILPIMPHRCDVVDSKITGPCVHCSYLSATQCPEGSTELVKCILFSSTLYIVAKCCKGFYGPDCKPCIGGFQHPCYDKGTCSDGIHGNGSCSCQAGWTGIACHICSDPNKHGVNCDEDCRCVHGTCDNRPGSAGVCRRGSCLEGFSGDLCDKTAMPCNADGLLQHCHIHAYCNQTGLAITCVCKDGYEGDGHSCTAINPCLKSNRGDCDTNAECVYAGPGNASCVCAAGWTGDGRVCVEINNCQLESRGGCSTNADCNHIGPGQSDCVCKTGYMGNGKVCVLINPCLKKNGGCHELAKCEKTDGGGHTCTCPDGYAGDGNICYGSLLDLYTVSCDQRSSHAFEDLNGNLTVLVPTRDALRNMSTADNLFWNSRHHLPYFLRLAGMDYKAISKTLGVIQIGKASILTPNLPAINGYLHVIDKILAPPLSDLPPEPPTLMAFLNSSSNFTLFREYVLMYNLSSNLTESFTLLLPTDEAIRQHLSRTNTSILDSDVFKYHVILNELLFPDRLPDGTLKSTLLGTEYQVQFHLDNNNQTVVNDIPLDGSVTVTQNGVIITLPQVLKVHRNRCNKMTYLQVEVRIERRDGIDGCLFVRIKKQFPANMQPNCRYRKRVGSRRKSVPGCVIKCLRTTMDHSCCPGYYGHECFKCPGDVGSWCSNHGECHDGNHGNGECQCYEGFHGTACEDCEPGRYGVNCSSKCNCANGKCEDGLTGSGRCVCYKGWKGASCSLEIKDDACGGVCDENANCITGPQGTAAVCVCTAGYEGNGTYCKELDLCSRSNGGCSEFAVCTKVAAGMRTCTCKQGYTGDGVICLEIDGCLINNGGCHKNAECIRAGPNIVRHHYSCCVCVQNNGECSRNARCEYMGMGQRNCTCHRGYIGDGINCRGSTNSVSHMTFNFLLSFERLYGDGPYTVFVPVEENNNISIVSADLVRSHIVSCEILTSNDFKTTERAVSVSGHTLHFSLIGVTIVKSDYTTFNGIIHHIDLMLTPYALEEKPQINPKMVRWVWLHKNQCARLTVKCFYHFLQIAGLLPTLNMAVHQPFTVFWPTNKAMESLPPERQLWLIHPLHRDRLAATLKAHIIRNSKVTNVGLPTKFSSFRTMHGSTIKFSCDRSLVGSIVINENEAKVVDRYLNFQNGVAYGIDQLLEPAGLGAFCDTIENRTTYGRCGNCIFTPSCPFKHYDTVRSGKREGCLNSRSRYRYSYLYDDLDRFSRYGCRKVCSFPGWVQKCCKNHFGRDCQVCSGGLEAPCGKHGDCNDGNLGTGTCRCHTGFRGESCELCAAGFYGPNCTACSCRNQGRCNDGIGGSGQCICKPGWEGDRCQNKIGSIPEECRQCHAQADCVQGVGCLCKPGFQGNGTFCTPEPPPDLCSEYNGGCHVNADCNQTGLVVNCTCRSDYQGDGYSCSPINRCTEEPNGGCSDFASCKFTGPNERECECLPGYVGNGVQCLEKMVPPVDRCLEDNGGCDPVAICKDLHYHGKTSGVFHLRSPKGRYQMNFSQADAECKAEGATLATVKQMGDAQQLGMHLCVAGWLDGGKAGYPTRYPSVTCGDNHVGLVLYKEPMDQSSKYDAYCYRLRDVSCACPPDYVGNGDFCNGVLTSVLATYSNISIFYKMLLEYSGTSSEGSQLVKFLSHRKAEVTLFVPHNTGFAPNQSLSGRDLEYHISANQSRWPFKELNHQTVITSRLGFNLTVTQGNNESSKLVNERLLLEWDIPAINGIIHIIEAPLTAPPPPVSHTHSSTTVTAILVTLMLVCALAALGCYVFKHKTDAFRFHYFRNEDEDGATGGRPKPTLVSIPNPLYVSSRALAEPFEVSLRYFILNRDSVHRFSS